MVPLPREKKKTKPKKPAAAFNLLPDHLKQLFNCLLPISPLLSLKRLLLSSLCSICLRLTDGTFASRRLETLLCPARGARDGQHPTAGHAGVWVGDRVAFGLRLCRPRVFPTVQLLLAEGHGTADEQRYLERLGSVVGSRVDEVGKSERCGHLALK